MTQFEDLVKVITRHAREHPDRMAVRSVSYQRSGPLADVLTYAELDREARRFASWLLTRCRPGDRALLLYPTGLDLAKALIGCMYAGVVVVHSPLPDTARGNQIRTAGVVRDAGIALVLTDAPRLADVTGFMAGAGLDDIPCVATDTLDLDTDPEWTDPANSAGTTAFLQYTSGSTSDPKGVVVNHGALMHNLQIIGDAFAAGPEDGFCGWLPLYHDMGLVGQFLYPLSSGAGTTLMAATDFVRHPVRWLQLIDEYNVTCTAAPNFAYELCMRRVTDEQLAGLDLSSLRCTLNGAEPIDAGTVRRFTERFAAAGLRPDAVKPCYGMAEATLFIAGTRRHQGHVATRVDAAALREHTFRPIPADADGPLLVSSGRATELELRIVDPETKAPLPAGRVGEIWVRGASVAAGYFGKPDETAETFGAVDADGDGPFLRTGDLGVLADDELYVTGRIKEVLVVNGKNLYPYDAEREVAALHDGLSGLSGSVFSIPAPQEQVVVLHELRQRGMAEGELSALAGEIKGRLTERLGVRIANVVLLRPGSVRKTSSGKIQRSLMRELFLSGDLQPIYQELSTEVRSRYRRGEESA